MVAAYHLTKCTDLYNSVYCDNFVNLVDRRHRKKEITHVYLKSKVYDT